MNAKVGILAVLKPAPDVGKTLLSNGTGTVNPICHDLEAAIVTVSG